MWENALEQGGYAGAWISAGQQSFYFQDDHGPKFQPNPNLAQWVDPKFLTPDSHLLIQAGDRPILFLHTPRDYWHAPAPLPDYLAPFVDVRTFSSQAALWAACKQANANKRHMAHITQVYADAEYLGDLNPPSIVDYVHFHRAQKTTYEQAAMRAASDIATAGHIAAAEKFTQGCSEFEIHMAYLQASQQTERDLPYGNIVALNEHASILHYQHQEQQHVLPARSFLIDAGGLYRGYASDITRTYVHQGTQHEDFAQLLLDMEQHQLELINSITCGKTFAELHVQMHQQLGKVLAANGIVTCTAEAAFERGITEKFCPHGLGHLLGLQVHDVGGHLANAQGQAAPPPPQYPMLRFTRAIAANQIFTIEPGIYFIPMLLAALATEKAPVNWSKVEALKGYGGIRIEDNVKVLEVGVENLTRDAFARIIHD